MYSERVILESFVSSLVPMLTVLVIVFLIHTVSFPLFACCLRIMGLGAPKYKKKALTNGRIDILVPVYNEKNEVIQSTLSGIIDSFKYSEPSRLTYRIVILSDPKLRQSYEAVTEWKNKNNQNNNIEILTSENISKWDSLKKLSGVINAEWCAFVDAGSVWDNNVISEVEKHILSGKFVCVAPSYEPKGAGTLYKLYWLVESYLKKIENIAGGSCSVHGATVFYDSRALKIAMQHLGNNIWYNDDVVIPLKIRTVGNLYYATAAKVYDYGTSTDFQTEKNRRSRMTFGNIQWIKALLLPTIKSNPVAGVIALRRAVRTFWAHILVLSVMYISINLSILSGIILFTIFATPIFVNKSLRAAFISSIKSIKNILSLKSSEVIWS